MYVNCVKEGTFEIRETHFRFLVLKQSPLSVIFAIVRFLGGAKFVLSGDPLYLKLYYTGDGTK